MLAWGSNKKDRVSANLTFGLSRWVTERTRDEESLFVPELCSLVLGICGMVGALKLTTSCREDDDSALLC